jgi:hypothetical protein
MMLLRVVTLLVLMLPLTTVSAKSDVLRAYHLSFEQPFTYGLLSGATLFLYPQREVTTSSYLMPSRGEVPQAYVKHVKQHVNIMVKIGTLIGLTLPVTLMVALIVFIRRCLNIKEKTHV